MATTGREDAFYMEDCAALEGNFEVLQLAGVHSGHVT